MCYDVHELTPPPLSLSFPLFIFLSTSHARPHSVVTLLSLILPLFLLISSSCYLRLFSHLCIFFLIVSLTSLIICQHSSPLYLFLHHLSSPFPFVYLSVCLSQQCICLCFGPAVSCLLLLYTHIHPAHICTSVCMSMTVWRSHPSNSKHKGKWEAGNDRRKVEWTERQGGRDKVKR